MGVERSSNQSQSLGLLAAGMFLALTLHVAPAEAAFQFGEKCRPSVAGKPVPQWLVRAATKPRVGSQHPADASDDDDETSVRRHRHSSRESDTSRRSVDELRGKLAPPLMWPIDPQCHDEQGEGEFRLKVESRKRTRLGVIPEGKVGFSMMVKTRDQIDLALWLMNGDGRGSRVRVGKSDVNGMLFEYHRERDLHEFTIHGRTTRMLLPALVLGGERETQSEVRIEYLWGTGIGQSCAGVYDCSEGLQCKSDDRCHVSSWCETASAAQDCGGERRPMGAGRWTCHSHECMWTAFQAATAAVYACGLDIALLFDRSARAMEETAYGTNDSFLDNAKVASETFLSRAPSNMRSAWRTSVISFADTPDETPLATSHADLLSAVGSYDALSTAIGGIGGGGLATVPSVIAALELAYSQLLRGDMPALVVVATPGFACAGGECDTLRTKIEELEAAYPHVYRIVLAPVASNPGEALSTISSEGSPTTLHDLNSESFNVLDPCSLHLAQLSAPESATLYVEEGVALSSVQPNVVGSLKINVATDLSTAVSYGVTAEVQALSDNSQPVELFLDLPDGEGTVALSQDVVVPELRNWFANSEWTAALLARHQTTATPQPVEVVFRLSRGPDQGTILSHRTMTLAIQNATAFAHLLPQRSTEITKMSRLVFNIVPRWVYWSPPSSGGDTNGEASWCSSCPDQIAFSADVYEVSLGFSTRSTVANLQSTIRLDVIHEASGDRMPWLFEKQTSTSLWHQPLINGDVPLEEWHSATFKVLAPGEYLAQIDGLKRYFDSESDHELIFTIEAPGVETMTMKFRASGRRARSAY